MKVGAIAPEAGLTTFHVSDGTCCSVIRGTLCNSWVSSMGIINGLRCAIRGYHPLLSRYSIIACLIFFFLFCLFGNLPKQHNRTVFYGRAPSRKRPLSRLVQSVTVGCTQTWCVRHDNNKKAVFVGCACMSRQRCCSTRVRGSVLLE